MNSFGKCAGILIFVALATSGIATSSQAEELEITHCYSGTHVTFNKTEGTSTLLSWAQNGIIMSAHPKALLQSAVTHCEGIQIGLGAARSLHGFCKITDADGDVILAEYPCRIKGSISR